jgi:hypothetical protein
MKLKVVIIDIMVFKIGVIYANVPKVSFADKTFPVN